MERGDGVLSPSRAGPATTGDPNYGLAPLAERNALVSIANVLRPFRGDVDVELLNEPNEPDVVDVAADENP